ncbi:signal peptide peptidase-domain-containing protein [Sporodiniella umbellata]|nr:signal peptide peptidase-domain-containing protein [Sporodiniella umbellata]
MKRPDNAPRTTPSASPLEDSDDEEVAESISSGQTFAFPIVGSAILFLIHFIYNHVHKDYVDYALTIYFSFVGYAAVSKTTMDLVRSTVPLSLLKSVDRYKVTISKRSKNLSYFHFTLVHMIVLWVSVGLSVFYSLSKHWMLSNLIALCIVRSAIQLFSLDSFRTGFLLTSGLCVYDLLWVFYPPLQALDSLDLPVRLVWPEDGGFARLGLGNMIIPGLLIALGLHYDRQRTWKSQPVGPFGSQDFSKPYFVVSLMTFTLGTTICFGTQQATFAWIAPACALTLALTSVLRGEDLFAYSTQSVPRVIHRKVTTEKKKTARTTPTQGEPIKELEPKVVEQKIPLQTHELVHQKPVEVEKSKKKKKGKK